MENKIIEGVIERIKKDRKALSLDCGEWYQSNFKVIDESINVKDFVKIVYSEKGNFKNIISIEKIKNDLNNEFELTNQTLNTIIMCAKDIKVAWINNGKEHTLIIPSFKEIVKEIKESFDDFKI